MSTMPMISVYMPSKNRGEMVKRAIDSVMAQDYPNFELVVVDDGSEDETPQILQAYAERYVNFHYLRNETSRGAAAARNQAINKAQGEFVTGIDDDDFFYPNRLSALMAAYDDQYAFVCSSTIWDWGDRQKLADGKAGEFSLKQQLSYNHASTQVLVRRERMLAIGGFDESLVARIDYDAWTCLMAKYGNAKRINPATYVLTREPGIERITNSKRNITGNQQFFAKHIDKMNWANRVNQEFWDMYAKQGPFGFTALIRQLCAGMVWLKLKYFIRINFLPNWRSQL